MVLTQQYEALGEAMRYYMFPYHYGSYATLGIQTIYKTPSLSFHTTMVLTQP